MNEKENRQLTILRSAVGSPPSMSIIKELKKNNVRVVGMDANPLSAGLYLCDKGYIVPKGDDPKFLKKLIKISILEKPNLILSGPEEEILTLSKNKEVFEKMGIIMLCPDYESVKICSDKFETWKFFCKNGIVTPNTYDKKDCKFPCIIKPRFGRGSRHVFKITNKRELNFYFNQINEPIIQEYVDGTEISVDVLADLQGIPLSIVPRIRLETESGVSIKGMTVYDKKIIQICQNLTKKLKLIGPSCFQFIKNEQGTKIIEINNRFGGGSILSMRADPTIIKNLINLGLGKPVTPNKTFTAGMMMLRYYEEVFITKNDLLRQK